MSARIGRIGALALVSTFPGFLGCIRAQLQSRSSSYAIVDSLSASAGARPLEFAGTLASDVITIIRRTENGKASSEPTVLEDAGRVAFHLALVDPGTAEHPTAPSTTNTITFTRYHVAYVRADGRNAAGIDVPYGFDGGLTVSVTGASSSVATFVLVRAQAKQEAPLRTLRDGGGAGMIATIAEVTFYGTDQAGRPVSATGKISVQFSDWGDPE